MTKSTVYPLGQIIIIKQKKLDEAEKVLRDKKNLLEKEQEKLLAAEKERDTVKKHRLAKLSQVREHMDAGAPSLKIQQMRAYLKVVDEKLKTKEFKVAEHKKAVAAAEHQVELARLDLIHKQQDVEKMKQHKTEWEKEKHIETQKKENLETDELGSVLHQRHAVKNRKKRSAE